MLRWKRPPNICPDTNAAGYPSICRTSTPARQLMARLKRATRASGALVHVGMRRFDLGIEFTWLGLSAVAVQVRSRQSLAFALAQERTAQMCRKQGARSQRADSGWTDACS